MNGNMKDKVKKFLENDEEKKLWEEIFEAFQKGGGDAVNELIMIKCKIILEEFEKYMSEIDKELGG